MYQTNGPARNGDSGGTPTNNDDFQQKMIRTFKRRFRDLCGELGGNKIEAIVQVGSAEALEKGLDQVSRKCENLSEKLDDTAEIDQTRVDEQDYDVSNSLRRWRTALLNRKQELLKDEKLKEKREKMLSEDMKTPASRENIQIKLCGLSNFLTWMENISSLTQKLPESTPYLKILSLIKNSISNTHDIKEIEEINSVEVLMKYFNSKYLSS